MRYPAAHPPMDENTYMFQDVPSYHNKRVQRKLHTLESKLKEQFECHIQSEKERQNLSRKLHLLNNQEGYNQTKSNIAKKLSENITANVWKEKELVRNKQRINKLRQRQGYSRVECAFMALDEDRLFANISASVIQPSNSDDNNNNAQSDQATATSNSGANVDDDFNLDSESLADFQWELRDQRRERDQLKEDLARAELNASRLLAELDKEQAKHNADKDQFAAQTFAEERLRRELNDRMSRQDEILQSIQTSASKYAPSAGISSPIKRLLDTYQELDDSSRQALWNSALTTNNVDLQRALFTLRTITKKENDPSSQAKLAKELIKLADTYKVPELKFDEQAKKRRYNFHTWIMKLRPILAMFPQTSSILIDDEIIPFDDPTCIGNKALYLLLGSRVDGYFQRAIKQHEGRGDKALALLKLQCANVNALDKDYFHQLFTSIRIKDNESATSYLR
jgi:hypothetical protein